VSDPIDPWSTVVGQDGAVAALRAAAARPVHAYLLLGRRGSGKRALARAFAAALVSATAPDDAGRAVRLALAGRHPDVHEVERAGPYITVDQAKAVVVEANRSGVESDRKVFVLVDFHLVQPNAVGLLLRTIEEPPGDSIFVVLAETVPPHAAPIASRCVRIELDVLSPSVIHSTLVTEGLDDERASSLAVAVHGDLDRARLLASDPRFELRQQAWVNIPHRLDGTGATVARIVAELLGLIEDAAAPLVERHAEELRALEERIERYGERRSGKRELTERQRRELRRHRTDEIRFGLATLAREYRDTLLASPPTLEPRQAVDAISAIDDAHQSLERNPNETLLLQSLLLRLPILRVTEPV